MYFNDPKCLDTMVSAEVLTEILKEQDNYSNFIFVPKMFSIFTVL